MKSIKDKTIAVVGGLGALCVACCTLPILAVIGLGSIEAYFCENEMLKGMGITLVVGSILYFIVRKFGSKSENACAINCGCKNN